MVSVEEVLFAGGAIKLSSLDLGATGYCYPPEVLPFGWGNQSNTSGLLCLTTDKLNSSWSWAKLVEVTYLVRILLHFILTTLNNRTGLATNHFLDRKPVVHTTCIYEQDAVKSVNTVFNTDTFLFKLQFNVKFKRLGIVTVQLVYSTGFFSSIFTQPVMRIRFFFTFIHFYQLYEEWPSI